jgi:chemotaxis protein methyltransferase CheR
MEMKVFDQLCSIAHREAGISLKAGKEALVASRVAKRLRVLGLTSEQEYLDHLSNDTSGEELVFFLDAISTNFTSFMREPDHFDMLTQWASQRSVQARGKVRLWCAAAATGEEPYTIAITLLDAFEGHKADIKILATDISTKALNAAIAGHYSAAGLDSLTAAQRAKYFEKSGSKAAGATYTVRPEVKQLVLFRRLNLSTPPFPMRGSMDVVFCRNVMIYFDTDTRQGLISEIERLLVPGGVLFTGHSETLSSIKTDFTVVRPSVYRKPADAGYGVGTSS